MAAVTNATPLISLDAVVTRHRDHRVSIRARRALLEAAAVRIAAAADRDPRAAFHSYVNPREIDPGLLDGGAWHRQ